MSNKTKLEIDTWKYPENKFGKFWQRKLKTCFRRLNQSGSGVLTQQDFEGIAEKMIRLGKLPEGRSKNVRQVMFKIWEDYYKPKDGTNGITADQYVEQKKGMVNGLLREHVIIYGKELFKAMDHNGDGMISTDEYKIFYEAWGIGEQAGKSMFHLMQKDNTISLHDFLQALADFYISEDEKSQYSKLFGELVVE